eukprot:gene21307-27604_t
MNSPVSVVEGDATLNPALLEQIRTVKDEYELNANLNLTDILFTICMDTGFILESSEENAWIRVPNGDSTNNDKPVLFFCFSETSRWVSLLQKICHVLNKSVLGYVGSENHGRCLKIQENETSDIFVLNIVFTGHLIKKDVEVAYHATVHEYSTLKNLNHDHLVKVKPNSLKIITTAEGDNLGLRYLMTELGIAVSKKDFEDREQVYILFDSLRKLHAENIFHRDARIANVILLDKRFVWIDLMLSSSLFLSESKMNDVLKLVESLFGSDKLNDPELQNLV